MEKYSNTNNTEINSQDRSLYYELIKNKIHKEQKREKISEWKLVASLNCELCGTIETLKYKLVYCKRINKRIKC